MKVLKLNLILFLSVFSALSFAQNRFGEPSPVAADLKSEATIQALEKLNFAVVCEHGPIEYVEKFLNSDLLALAKRFGGMGKISVSQPTSSVSYPDYDSSRMSLCVTVSLIK